MFEEIRAIDQNYPHNEQVEQPGPLVAQVLPALLLAVLAVVVVGGYLLYQRSGLPALLSVPRPARIVFMSDRSGNWELYIMDSDGGNLLNLTNHPASDGVPIQVPGQDRLAFASNRDGVGLDLFVMDLEGGNATNITHTPESNEVPIAWSPDGEHLAFATDQSGAAEIFLVQATGEGLLNLTQRDLAQAFDDWSPEPGRFMLSAGSGPGVAPLITDLNGATHQPLTDGSYPAGGGRWSPDGQQVAFMAIGPGGDSINIFLVDAAGGEPVNLTQSPANDRFPRWSPDGTHIAFVSDRDGNSEIYVMDIDGSHLANLTNTPSDESIQGDFAWSPDGTRILFHSTRDDDVEIYVMDADGSNPVNLTDSPGIDFRAIWVE
jgi:Tol biopolymer transport system component